MDTEQSRFVFPECCGMGCKTCVLDLYQKELELQKNDCPFETGTHASEMTADSYLPCHIVEVEDHSVDCRIYHFSLPDGIVIRGELAQHLVVRETFNGESLIRCYTLLSPPGVSNQFSVLVKLYDDGCMSQVIRQNWAVGTRVLWRGPIGNFTYRRNSYKRIFMLAAGTGIVPLYNIARSVISDEDDETFISLIFCCKSYKEIPLREEVRELQQFWNFKALIYLSQDEEDNVCKLKRHNEQIVYTKLTRELLFKELSVFCEKDVQDTLVLLCGTREFEDCLLKYLAEFGFDSPSVVRF